MLEGMKHYIAPDPARSAKQAFAECQFPFGAFLQSDCGSLRDSR